jgi:ubiquinone/menaquinone biosynthesis C-methylase UbiE
MRVTSLEGHRLWAAAYDTLPNPLLALETRSLASQLGDVSGSCFIDIACGTGRWTTYLCERGASVYGADLCSEMLEGAKKKSTIADRVLLADASALPFRARLADATLCSFSAGYFPDLGQAMAEMSRVTKPGGRVYVSDFHPLAVAFGWNRSFRVGTEIYELEDFAYTVQHFHSAGRRAGLAMVREYDAYLGEEERSIFDRAGKGQSFDRYTTVPAVWIGVWRKHDAARS